MQPHKMLCGHNPAEGEFGDCLRTVIACLLDRHPSVVPHFAHDGADVQTVWRRVDDYLDGVGLVTWNYAFPGEAPLDDVLNTVGITNPNMYYLISGKAGGADHIVIALNGEIVHDPSRFGVGLRGPGSTGYWLITTLVSNRLKA